MRAIRLKAVFVDANPTLAGVAERLLRLDDVVFADHAAAARSRHLGQIDVLFGGHPLCGG